MSTSRLFALAAAGLLLCGCQSGGGTSASSAADGSSAHRSVADGFSTPAAGGALPASPTIGSGSIGIIQEPADDYRSIDAAIDSARSTLDITMYELADKTAQEKLVAAQHRGVKVRIILDRAFHGEEANKNAYDQLTAAGIAVNWAPTGQIFHQKTLIVDGERALIGTGNLTSRYYSTTRDAWISDTNPTQVLAIAATFAADWASPSHSGNAVGAPGLVWSPGASQQMVAYIGRATSSIDFSSEELSDKDIIAALSAAARRGVTCRVVMTDSASWSAGFEAVSAAGCSVHVFPDTAKALYIHEKEILVDGKSLLIGSQNASVTSLNKNRELSIEVTSAPVVQAAVATFNADYAAAPIWKPKT